MKTLFFFLLLNSGFITTVMAQDKLAYWPNGNKKLERKNLQQTVWYENGKKKEEGDYKIDGKWQFWNEDGKLIFAGVYQINLSDAKRTFVHPSKKLLEVDTVYIQEYVKNNLLSEGLTKREYVITHVDTIEEGCQPLFADLKKETKEGYWRYYKDEKLVKEEWYVKGKLKK